MIDQVDKRLRDWTQSSQPGIEVTFGEPSDVKEGMGVNLYLFDLVNSPPARGNNRPPMQVALRYLVTVWAAKPEEAHHLLGNLIFAAMDNTEFEIELDPIPVALWRALGTAPRPAFVIRVPLRRDRPEPERRLVRAPLVVRQSPMRSVEGTVVGPGDIPIANARVELPGLGRYTRTDSKGRFAFSAVPTEPSPKLLVVKAKGKEMSVSPAEAAPDGEQLVIRLHGLEE